MEATLLSASSASPQEWIVDAAGRPVHVGQVCHGGTTCSVTGQDRRLGDYFTNVLDRRGSQKDVEGHDRPNAAAPGSMLAGELHDFPLNRSACPPMSIRRPAPASSMNQAIAPTGTKRLAVLPATHGSALPNASLPIDYEWPPRYPCAGFSDTTPLDR
jgi:hypothetical protein